MRPVPQVGANLFVCIPPDHMRDDLPSAVGLSHLAGIDRVDAALCNPNERMVYISVIDDMGNTVTLPCFGVRVDEGRVVLMAHRIGRPDKTVVDMPFQTPFYLRWPDGWVSKESFWHGLVLDYGPCQMSADLYSDGTVEEVGRPGYRSTRGVRWFRTREEAEAAS